MSIRFRWLGYVCFEFILPSGKVLVVDPYIDHSPTAPIKSSQVTGADYIAITHGHFDHVTDVGILYQQFRSKVICSRDIAEPLSRAFNIDAGDLFRVSAGDRLDFGDLRLEVKRGQHINLLPPLRKAYARTLNKEPDPNWSWQEVQKELEKALNLSTKRETATLLERLEQAGMIGGEQLNFLFQTEDHLRLLLFSSAPEDYFRPLIQKARIQVLFIQLGGTDPEKAAELAALSGAPWIVPTHHDGPGIEKARSKASQFAEKVGRRTSAQVLNIEHGQWYEIGIYCREI